PQARLHTGGDIEGDGAAGAHPALTCTGAARRLDPRAETLAAAARLGGDDVAQQAAHLTLDVPGAAADVTGHRGGARLAAAALAGLAEHGRVHLDVPVHAEHDIAEIQVQAHQCVFTALATRARAGRATAAARRTEERLEDVAEAAEPSATEAAVVVAAHVVAATGILVSEHVVGMRDELEPLGRVLTRVHVGVQLPRELAVGLLDLVLRCVTGDPEYFVMIRHDHLSACA